MVNGTSFYPALKAIGISSPGLEMAAAFDPGLIANDAASPGLEMAAAFGPTLIVSAFSPGIVDSKIQGMV
jgi:hypothetical protein